MTHSSSMSSVDRRLVSIQTVAEALDVHPQTIRSWVATGRLTGYRLGRKAIRVDWNDVEKLLHPIPAHRVGH